MGEFASLEEDWCLEAIVRGFTDDHSLNMSCFDDLHFDFPPFFEAKNDDDSEDALLSFNELDQVYKPVGDNSFSLQDSVGASSSSSSINGKDLELEDMRMKKNAKRSTIHAVKYKKK